MSKFSFCLFLLTIFICLQNVNCNLFSFFRLFNTEHSHTFVHDVLHGLNHNPNETILKKYFDQVLEIPKFKKCFIKTTMENDRQFIFEQPLGVFIHNFLVK